MIRSIDRAVTASGVVFVDEPRASENIFSLQLSGTFTATVAVEVSNDGITWVNHVGALSGQGGGSAGINQNSPGITVYMVQTRYIRVNVPSYTSGTINISYSIGSSWLR